MGGVWTYVEGFIFFFNLFILFYFLSLNLFYMVLSILAAIDLFKLKMKLKSRYRRMEKVSILPTISILSPAYNEEVTITESVKSLMKVEYPGLEVVVINDGSSDGTMRVLREDFKLVKAKRTIGKHLETKPIRGIYKSEMHDNLFVVDKDNGGKADALNSGVNFSRANLFCAIDADSLLEKRALLRLVEEHMTEGGRIIALGGIIRIANDCRIEDGEILEARLPRKFLPSIQAVEYIRAFLAGRAGFNMMNALLIISGAFGLFERKAVIDVGGYRHDTVGEDMELIVRLHRIMREKKEDYRIIFVPDPVCWTQAPDDLKVLSRQRNRWQRGLLESLYHNRKMAFNPKYGPVGMLAMPFFLIYEGFGPIFEVTGYVVVTISVIMGWINLTFFFVFLLLAILFGVILTMASLIMEEGTVKKYKNPMDLFRMVILGVIENLGYRQLVTYWRLKGIYDLIKRKKSWGKMTRKKFT